MQEKNTSVFERFPESEGLQRIKDWFVKSGYTWIYIKGDSCAYIPFNQPALDDLQKPSLQNKNLFIKRIAAGNDVYIYVSVSNLAKELLQHNTAMLHEVEMQVKTFHEEQITPGKVMFDPKMYEATEKGVHQAFSDIAHQQMEYRTVKQDRLLVSRTLTKENAGQLLEVCKAVLPELKAMVCESWVNPGFYRVMVNENQALSALKKAQAKLVQAKYIGYNGTGYSVENTVENTETCWVKQVSEVPDVKRKNDDALFKRPEGSPSKRLRPNSQTLGL